MPIEKKIDRNSPKVLIISPYPVIPPDTGAKIRIYELAHGISVNGIKVKILVPISPTQYCRKRINRNLTIDVVPYPFVIPFLLTDKPFSYMYLISLHPWYRFFIKKHLENHDIIQFEQASFGDIVDHIPGNKTVVYDAHNVEAEYVASECRYQWTEKISTRRIFNLENNIVQRADQILACSENDAKKICDIYGTLENKLKIIHNGIHIDGPARQCNIDYIKRKFPKLLGYKSIAIFSGSDVAHNRSAVRFIMESIATKLRRQCAFVLKGQCSKRFQNHKLENVFLDPVPGNVSSYSNICTVALNPIFQGSGTSLKVLDYLANGLPVITTEFGMRGYEDLKSFVTLSDENSFAQKILEKPKFLPATLDAIRKYTWESAVTTLKNIYNQ
jgi:glycosyltransferase involved in cell wall biosynthesis